MAKRDIFGRRVYVPKFGDIRRRIISESHKTMWDKVEQQKPGGLLEPLPVAERPWESVTMDFITCLPKSGGYSTIMVVVDRFSKYATFMPASPGCTAKEAAKLFFKNVVNYILLCISEDCEWRFKVSSINKSQMFKVREFNDKHTCPLKDKVYEQRQASSSLIGGIIRSKFANHKRKYTPKDIINDVKSDFGVDVSYMLAWRAKEKAMNFLRGEPADSYNKLSGYLYTIDMTYPGSHITMGFDHCRPIVVVDTNHRKSAYTRTFVSASTLDGAVHILPLAYGVIDSENDVAWSWFFEQFKEACGQRENMCIISDRNKSIIKYVSRVYPTVPHFACIWHLWNSVYKKFKKIHSKLSEIYFSMEKAYTQDEFDSLMEKMEKVDIQVKEYLELAGYEKWVRLYAPVNRRWTITSNIAESINTALVLAR
ncbi:uncharacterized protein LOC107806614 [Nicotiana tabacum]|uniref:uncharacterized protein LOC107806614 n=1 Tax=Nicotiana tabacum TaxID=4097 RepID=UPI003F4F0188